MTNNEKIGALAKKHGFTDWAVISAEPFYRYKEDLDIENYGEKFSIRYNPKDYAPDAQNIIVLIKPYNPFDEKCFTSDYVFVDAYYVAGNEAYFSAKQMNGEIQELGFTSHFSPKIPFRYCAMRAGFGKRGMNGLLINERYGSYFHIQCIMTDMPLEITSDVEEVEICQDCKKCVDACKGCALDGTGRVEIKNCVRHYMPVHRYVPEEIRSIIGTKLIGCTDCRDCCPHNENIEKVVPPNDLLEACYIPMLIDREHEKHKEHLLVLQNYLGKNEIRPLKLFKSLAIIAGNTGDEKYIKYLEKLKATENDEELLEYVEWGIKKLTKE